MLENKFGILRSKDSDEKNFPKPIFDESFGTFDKLNSFFVTENYFGSDKREFFVGSLHRHDRTVSSPFMFPVESDLREIDIKSVGKHFQTDSTEYNNKEIFVRSTRDVADWGGSKYMGVGDFESFAHDHEIQKKLKKLGVRTHESLLVVPLTEIEFGGFRREIKFDKVSGQYYFEKGNERKFWFDKGFIPAQQLRGWGTQLRVEDVNKTALPIIGEIDKKEKLDYAIQLVEDELRRKGELSSKEKFGPEEYLTWFAKTLGQNLGRMHKAGYTHRFLHPGNVTLDCRLTDFDSVRTLKERKKEIINYIYRNESGISPAKIGSKVLSKECLADLLGIHFAGKFIDISTNYRSGEASRILDDLYMSVVRVYPQILDKGSDLFKTPQTFKKMLLEEYEKNSDGLINFSIDEYGDVEAKVDYSKVDKLLE